MSEPLALGLATGDSAADAWSRAPMVPGRVSRLLRKPTGLIGVILFGLVMVVVVFGSLMAPYGADELAGPPSSGPSSAHLLGTDTLGRDVLSRVLSGGDTVILLPFLAMSLALTVSAVLALVAGYVGGALDAALTRLLDVLFTIPAILLVIVVMAGFGTGNLVLVVTVAIVSIPMTTRILRAATQSVASRDFVLAARVRGESTARVAFWEIGPNIGPILLAEAALVLSRDVLVIASLSFLGLGVRPPEPNWGVMVAENRGLLLTEPLAVFAPAALIAALAVSINLVAEALTDVLAGREHGATVMG